jgi:hypothetical protein
MWIRRKSKVTQENEVMTRWIFFVDETISNSHLHLDGVKGNKVYIVAQLVPWEFETRFFDE